MSRVSVLSPLKGTCVVRVRSLESFARQPPLPNLRLSGPATDQELTTQNARRAFAPLDPPGQGAAKPSISSTARP